MPQPVYGPPAGRLQAVMRSKWFMPLSSLGLGVVILRRAGSAVTLGLGWCRLRS
jgi:hypothetical protein